MNGVLGVTYAPETREQTKLVVMLGGVRHPKDDRSLALLTVKAPHDDVVELWLTREQARALGLWLIEAGQHLEDFPHGVTVSKNGVKSATPAPKAPKAPKAKG